MPGPAGEGKGAGLGLGWLVWRIRVGRGGGYNLPCFKRGRGREEYIFGFGFYRENRGD